MKKLLIVSSVLLLLTIARASDTTDRVASVEKDVLEGRLFIRSEQALNQLMKVAVAELAKKNKAKAETLKTEWETKYRKMYFVYENERDIGDHAPLNKWLAEKYEILEFTLGMDVMKMTRLVDIKTFLYCPPVVFRPCKFPMDSVTIPRIDEYKNHFSYGEKYTGLVPVTTYWVTYAAITFGSSGTFVMVAGLGAMAAEKAMMLISPKLSDKVFKARCGG